MIPYIKVIKQYERIAVFTLGKYSGAYAARSAPAVLAVPRHAHG